MATGIPRLSQATPEEVKLIVESPLGEQLHFLMTRAQARTHYYTETALSKYGSNARLHTILAFLSEGITTSQQNLARLLNIDPSQVVALVDKLMNNGYVERRADQNDRRSNAIAITEEGQKHYHECEQAMEKAEEEILGTISPRDIKYLKKLLAKVSI